MRKTSARTDETRTGPGRSSRSSGAERRDRLALASAGIPFRLKVALVWVGIFGALAFFFWLAAFDNAWIIDRVDFIAKGLTFTIATAIGGIVLAVVLALVGALGRLSRNPIAFGLSGFYTSFFRGTPLIVQLFLFYSALPLIGQNLSTRIEFLPSGFDDVFIRTAFEVGILVLGLNYGAYMTEIFRAGIQSVSHGQAEAADALGMTYAQKMKRVVLPQAFRVIIPPTGNEFIAMMKDTALVSFLGVALPQTEIFRRAQLAGISEVHPLEAYITAAGLYWALTAIFTFFQGRLERRIGRGYVRADPTTKKARPGPATVEGAAVPGTEVVDQPKGGPELPGQGH